MSRFQRFLKYLTTQNGRETSLYCVFALGTGSFVFKWLPQNWCLQNYREFLACYKDGFERKVPNNVQKRFEKALDLLQIDDLDRKRTNIFTVIGYDTFHAGSRHTVFGSIIGVPVNYAFEKESDVPTADIVIKGEPVQWSSEAGQMFKKSLILTEDEQIYGICREILYTRTWKMPLECAFPILGIFSAYALSHTLNNKLSLFQRPRGMRVFMYTLVSLFVGGNYCFIKDYTSCKYDITVDQELAALGDKMVQAGVGYYDKILKRNVAIRNLTGDNSTFSSTGNVNNLFRQYTLPLTVRKTFFESKLEELKGAAQIVAN